jgi:valyl-tRNA synthetase
VLEASTVVLPLAGLVDIAAERTRLEKELAGAEKRQTSLSGQLANESFRRNAKPSVVAKLEDDLRAVDARIDALRKSIQEL